MSAHGMNHLQSLPHTEASTKGDKTPAATLNLAWRCLFRVNAVPATDHQDWTTCMNNLWQLGGIDQGGQDRSLEWEWVVSSHKKLAMRLHPDKLNNVLNDPSCTLPALTRKALSGL